MSAYRQDKSGDVPQPKGLRPLAADEGKTAAQQAANATSPRKAKAVDDKFAAIAQSLRTAYQRDAEESVPDELMDLLSKLK